MPTKLGDMDQQLFDRSVWTEPLFKFAQVSGMVISLYDSQGKRWCGPCFNNPLAARLARAGIWEPTGWGSAHERVLVERCVARQDSIHALVFDIFGQLAVPCHHKGKVVLVFVLGWVHQRAADPVILESLSRQLDVPLVELGSLIRMMPPIPEENLRAHAQMLATFSASILQKILIQNLSHRQASDLKILSDTAFALAGATTEEEVCQIAHRGLKGLIRHACFLIQLNTPSGSKLSTAPYEDEVSCLTHPASVRRHISLPILGAQGKQFGKIEIIYEHGVRIESILDSLYALAGQMAEALYKNQWLSSPQTKCRILEGTHVELRRLHQAKDAFLASVSHELKAPLSAIMGWAQFLREDIKGADDWKDTLHAIEGSARHQSRLIEDLLDISCIISGRLNLEREDIDATVLLGKTLETIRPMIQSRRQKLELQMPAQPIRLHGDRTRLHQVLWNLLSNASKFTQDGGHITVILEDAAPYVRFEVIDSGQGIGAIDIARLFDGFEQAGNTAVRSPTSLGLGLAIVKHLVAMHGGYVTVKSEGEGQGASFSVFLPQISYRCLAKVPQL